MFVYRITFENYEGDNFIELYHHEENATARYNELYNEGKHYSEFESDSALDNQWRWISYFNANINEYSTIITLHRIEYDQLFEDRA